MYRTPDKEVRGELDARKSPSKTVVKKSLFRKSLETFEGRVEQRSKPTSPKASGSMSTNPPENPSKTANSPKQTTEYPDRITEAKAYAEYAKRHLGDSRNLRSDIKAGVTKWIDRLVILVRDMERGSKLGQTESICAQPVPQVNYGDLSAKLEEHTKLLAANTEQLRELRQTIDNNVVCQANTTYANVAARPPTSVYPDRPALHSVIISSERETETGEEVLERVREAVDAKEGWVKVERVRRAKDRKIIIGCSTKDDRDKVRERLKARHLVVEDVKNKDPLVILRDVLSANSDEDILKALRNQNRGVFDGLEKEENRVQIKYRKKARNPHTCHMVLAVAPVIWRRVTEMGALHVDLQRVRVMDQSPLVQCSRCLAYGHTRKYCTEEVDACSHCGGPHLRSDCDLWAINDVPKCRNCLRAKMTRTEHNAFSEECPIRRRWETLARSTVAYC